MLWFVPRSTAVAWSPLTQRADTFTGGHVGGHRGTHHGGRNVGRGSSCSRLLYMSLGPAQPAPEEVWSRLLRQYYALKWLNRAKPKCGITRGNRQEKIRHASRDKKVQHARRDTVPGTAQGSTLGPTMWREYTNDLPESIKGENFMYICLRIFSYASSSTLYPRQSLGRS